VIVNPGGTEYTLNNMISHVGTHYGSLHKSAIVPEREWPGKFTQHTASTVQRYPIKCESESRIALVCSPIDRGARATNAGLLLDDSHDILEGGARLDSFAFRVGRGCGIARGM